MNSPKRGKKTSLGRKIGHLFSKKTPELQTIGHPYNFTIVSHLI